MNAGLLDTELIEERAPGYNEAVPFIRDNGTRPLKYKRPETINESKFNYSTIQIRNYSNNK